MIDHGAVLLAARSHLLDLEVATTDGGFARSTTATYTDVSGVVQTAAVDEYRDAHYVNGVLTPLYEAAGTNRALQSQSFLTSPWTNNGGTQTANAATAPDGTMTAHFCGVGNIRQFITGISGTTVTLSCYMKNNGTTSSFLGVDQASPSLSVAVRVTWSGAVPTLSVFSGSWTNLLAEALDDDWYRISATLSGLTNGANIYPNVTGSSTGIGGAYLWGFQCEYASAVSSYIPTTTLAATRAADTGGLAATTTGFTRASGSFLTDGFAIGMEVTPTGFTTATPGTITALTATTMTVTGTRTADSAAGGRTLAVALPTVRAWENVDATPVVGAPWIEEAYLPGAADKPSVTSEGYVEVLPIYSITVRTPLGIGTAGILGYVDALLAHFAPSTPLTLTSGDGLTVRGRPAPTASPIVRGEGWAACQVSIPLRLITANSR